MKLLPAALLCLVCGSTTGFTWPHFVGEKRLATRSPLQLKTIEDNPSFNVQVNEFFKGPVPKPIKSYLEVQTNNINGELDLTYSIQAGPAAPGVPRPLWLVILASLPTGLVWYGYYKFCIEEELLYYELSHGMEPKGYGGYGTLGPFTYALLFGFVAPVLHLPGGSSWAALGIIYIYYTQFLLYVRVNELLQDQGKVPPLQLWWTLPIFFPFNLIVGLRQVHALSNYWYEARNLPVPEDPVVQFFPFIGAENFTWQEFLTTPSLWCQLLAQVEPMERQQLPEPVQAFLRLGEEKKTK